MGTMTAIAMGAQVRNNLGGRTTASGDLPDDTNIVVWLNHALNHIASPRVYRHRELQVTTTLALVTGTADYTIGSSPETTAVIAAAIRNPSNTTDRHRLHPIRDREAFDISGVAPAGRPYHYALFGATQIEVLPAPSSTYNAWNLYVRRYVVPTQFALTGSTLQAVASPLHTFFDEALIVGATWRGWRFLQDWERADQAKLEFGQVINEVTERMDVEAEDTDFGPALYVEESM
jgi:hypothetical protein